MIKYQSKSGKASGILAYETGKDFIIIEFQNKSKYKYSYKSTGSLAVEAMKKFARASEGLSTYISKNKPLHERKPGSFLKKLNSRIASLFS